MSQSPRKSGKYYSHNLIILFLLSTDNVIQAHNFTQNVGIALLGGRTVVNSRPRISSLNMLKGQGHFHFAEGTSIGKS